MSDNGFVPRWQRTLRDDPETSDLDWKVGLTLSTYADQYTDPARGYLAGHHARPGVRVLSAASHVAWRNIKKPMDELIKRGYIELTGTVKNTYEYRLIIPGELEGS